MLGNIQIRQINVRGMVCCSYNTSHGKVTGRTLLTLVEYQKHKVLPADDDTRIEDCKLLKIRNDLHIYWAVVD